MKSLWHSLRWFWAWLCDGLIECEGCGDSYLWDDTVADIDGALFCKGCMQVCIEDTEAAIAAGEFDQIED